MAVHEGHNPSKPLRRFEMQAEDGTRYWELKTSGNAILMSHGPCEGPGKSELKVFATAEEREQAAQDQIALLIEQGYQECAGPESQTLPETPTQTPPKDEAVELLEAVDVAARVSDRSKAEALMKQAAGWVVARARQMGLDRILASVSAAKRQPSEDPETRAMEQKVCEFARQYRASRHHGTGRPDQVSLGEELLAGTPDQQVLALKACYALADTVLRETSYDTLDDLRERLLQRKLPFTQEDIEFLAFHLGGDYGDKRLLTTIERYAKEHALSEKTLEMLRRASRRTRQSHFFGEGDRVKARIDALTGDDAQRLAIHPGEPWADAAIKEIEVLPEAARTAWIKLIQHCVAATSGKPSRRWSSHARELVEAITPSQFLDACGRWFALLNQARTPPRLVRSTRDPLALNETNQDILRGLVWCCGYHGDSATARIVTTVALSCYKKLGGIGPRATRVGNACVFALGELAEHGGLGQLAILAVKVKFAKPRDLVQKQLQAAADRLGIAPDEVEELAVPHYDLDDVGVRKTRFGDFVAELQIDDRGATHVAWRKPDGKTQKSVPKAVRDTFAEELKEWKSSLKEIQKMLGVQRERLDSMFLDRKSWTLERWRDRYLDHPLVGTLARRLIWCFRNEKHVQSGIYHGDRLVGPDGAALELGDDAQVEMWHPVSRPTQEVQAWRRWLEGQGRVQPFKQAHREVYVVTPAEQETRIYSNRFAAHVLRQSQLRTLAQSRRWIPTLVGPWDGGGEGIATRKLDAWEAVAEFWYTAAADDFHPTAGNFYVSTDQVRFSMPDSGDPMLLTNVPPLVFSEVMRDVDLFVGVASVGNDPTWSDGGPDAHFRDYWESYSFGELTTTARTRKEVLETLLPKLAIASRCRLADRFLIVQGDLHEYKIHLGSGNVMRSPRDQYLCIVADRRASRDNSPRLPFEGDSTLSIILSKALLLAHDSAIDDPSILAQLK